MRFKGLAITFLVLASLLAVSVVPGYAMKISTPQVKKLFDLSPSAWTTDTYPAFKSGASSVLYNAETPKLSFSLGQAPELSQMSNIKYNPIFDMSPGALSFNTYPVFKG